MKTTPFHLRLSLLASCVALLCSTGSHAAGYRIYEQSASAAGNAYAGRGAQVEDATIVQSNPAGMVYLKQAQLSVGSSLISVSSEYENAEATNSVGASLRVQDSGELDLLQAVPYLFYTSPLNDRISWGVGLFVPFGLGSDYDNDWTGRYFADETEVIVLTLQPSIAYKITDTFSVGLGIGINYAEGLVSKYNDYSGMCESEDYLNAAYGSDVFNDAYCNSHSELEGDDLAVGYTLGLHWQPFESTRLGLIYHSKVDYEVESSSEVTNVPILGANTGGDPILINVGDTMPAIDLTTGLLAASDFVTESARLELTTPQSLAVTVDQDITRQLSFQTSLFWTEWSCFENLSIISNEENGPISSRTETAAHLNADLYLIYAPEHWNDTYSGSIGLTWRQDDRLQLKMGYAYDKSPISDKFRTARMPDSDRHWITFGAKWKMSPKWVIDAAYGYMWAQDSSIEEYHYNVQDQRIHHSALTADYSSKAHVFSLQVNYLFD